MAKRRKLQAPSADDLNKIEAEFRRETPLRSAMAPIAQVAAETAPNVDPRGVEERAKSAKDTADAEAFRDAHDKGLVMVEIPLDQIDADDMLRDRAHLDEAEMDELRISIRANGLRLPIELYELDPPDEKHRYGLLSGYRRLMAVRGLWMATGEEGFATIKAIIRTPGSVAGAFAAMVEENEVRASLSHFERGRIAALAAQNGVFTNVEEAVDTLFTAASKAKRSKVRSFALIFEELGDMLAFPEALTEKQGLKVAAALRAGGEADIREALAVGQGGSAEEEWTILEDVLAGFEDRPRDTRRGGRPPKVSRRNPGPADEMRTSTGFVIRREHDSRGYAIRFSGRHMDTEMLDVIMGEIRRLLESPDR